MAAQRPKPITLALVFKVLARREQGGARIITNPAEKALANAVSVTVPATFSLEKVVAYVKSRLLAIAPYTGRDENGNTVTHQPKFNAATVEMIGRPTGQTLPDGTPIYRGLRTFMRQDGMVNYSFSIPGLTELVEVDAAQFEA